MYGTFGSYVSDTGIATQEDLIDKIFEQEANRNPGFNLTRDNFNLINFAITCPPGTRFYLNGSEDCTVVITDTKQFIVPLETYYINSCIFLEDCASVNCRYLY